MTLKIDDEEVNARMRDAEKREPETRLRADSARGEETNSGLH